MPRPDRAAGRPPTVLALIALVIGLAIGILASASRSPALLRAAAIVEPLGTLWVNAIRMTLVPLVFSLLITSVASFADVRALSRLGARTVTLFLVLLAGVAVFAAIISPPIFDRMPVDPATASALRATAVAEPEASEQATLRAREADALTEGARPRRRASE